MASWDYWIIYNTGCKEDAFKTIVDGASAAVR